MKLYEPRIFCLHSDFRCMLFIPSFSYRTKNYDSRNSLPHPTCFEYNLLGLHYHLEDSFRSRPL